MHRFARRQRHSARGPRQALPGLDQDAIIFYTNAICIIPILILLASQAGLGHMKFGVYEILAWVHRSAESGGPLHSVLCSADDCSKPKLVTHYP